MGGKDEGVVRAKMRRDGEDDVHRGWGEEVEYIVRREGDNGVRREGELGTEQCLQRANHASSSC